MNNTLKTVIDALEDKKAENISLIDISEVSTIADHFVITNGANTSQIQALADHVEEKLAQNGIHPRSVEGYPVRPLTSYHCNIFCHPDAVL